MLKNSIPNVLGFLMSLLILSACSRPVEPIKEIQIVTRPVSRPAPIVPSVDPLELRNIEWFVVTEQNYQGILMMMRDAGQEPVIFAVTAEGYQNILLNQNDIISSLRQHQKIIATYKSYFDSCC